MGQKNGLRAETWPKIQTQIMYSDWGQWNMLTHHRAILTFILTCVYVHLTNVGPIFTLLKTLFCSPPIPEGNMWL